MYKVEELKFYKMKKSPIFVSNPYKRNGLTVFQIENKINIDEKIAFIDELKDGVATYLLNILTKWEQEKDTLPKDNYGNPKTVSKKAWIKRNDKRKIIDTDYKIGQYHLFGTKFKSMSITCPTTEYGYNLEYTDSHMVHQWFHDLCEKLYQEERKYFREHDPFQIKLKQVRDYGKNYRICFDSDELNDIIWNGKENVSEEKLDRYVTAYQQLEKEIKNISNELNH